jgi:hypothetical protein
MSIKNGSLAFRLFSLPVLLILLFSITGVTPAHAAGILYVKGVPWGFGNCLSWATACSFQYALAIAASGDELWVTAGTYKPTSGTDRTATFQLKSGVAVYGGFVGTETARAQRNPTTNLTTLSGDLNGNDVGFTNNSENSYTVVKGATGATLDGFTIQGGNANDEVSHGNGGGMLNISSSPTVSGVTFSSNAAAFSGGGMFNANGSNPSLMNVTFSGNSVVQSGGGMGNHSSSPTLTNVTFNGNFTTLSNGKGGGMANSSSSNPTLTNVNFYGNASDYGGGMNNAASSPTLTNVTFRENGMRYGGGVYNDNSSPTLTNVTFFGNVSSSGGGMFNANSSPTLTNVTFCENEADYYGGGMYNETSSSPAIRNTIFWGNTAVEDGAQIYNTTVPPAVSDCVVQGGYGFGTNIITTDPLLAAPGNYGGFTQTIPLLSGSSAIDTGNDAVCPSSDQRGVGRPQGAHCDIGAFEFATGTGLYTITPCRVFDTRNSTGSPILAGGEQRSFSIVGKCGIPSNAKAIVANVTVVSGAVVGNLSAIAGNLASTVTTVIEIPLARARANNATIQLATDNTGTIRVINNASGTVHVILDVSGYFR